MTHEISFLKPVPIGEPPGREELQRNVEEELSGWVGLPCRAVRRNANYREVAGGE